MVDIIAITPHMFLKFSFIINHSHIQEINDALPSLNNRENPKIVHNDFAITKI